MNGRRSAVAASCAGLVVLLGAWAAGWAQDAAPREGTGARAALEYSQTVDINQFAPADPRTGAQEVSAPLVVSLAYGLIWLLTLGFVLAVWRRGRALSEEVAEASERLRALDAAVGKALAGASEGRADASDDT